MSRRLGWTMALALFACGPTRPDDGRIACGKQTACDTEHRKVCDAGYCSDTLPAISEHYEQLGLQLTTSMQLAGPKALRAAVLYRTTPDGKTVRCPDATLGANDVAVGSMADLVDPFKFNETAPLLESNLHNTGGDVIDSDVSVNGTGRVVYVELYSSSVTPGQPDTGGTPIGYGCVENAPFDDDPTKAAVNIELKTTR